VRAEIDRQIKEKLEETGTKAEFAWLDPECSPQLGEFLDVLGVHSECCRGVLMCQIDIRDSP